MRFHLVELLIVTAVAAFAAAALRFGEYQPVLESLFVSLTLLVVMLCVSIASGAIGVRQRYWVSFSVCMILYLVFSQLVPDPNGQAPRQRGPEITTAILESAYEWRLEADNDPNAVGLRWTGNPPVFFRIGHCAWALFIGWLGAHMAKFIRSRNHEIPPT